jgi:hypothetical protein
MFFINATFLNLGRNTHVDSQAFLSVVTSNLSSYPVVTLGTGKKRSYLPSVGKPDKAHAPPAEGLPESSVHHARVTPSQPKPAALLAKPELGDAREAQVEAADGDTSGNGAARAEVVSRRERRTNHTNTEAA